MRKRSERYERSRETDLVQLFQLDFARKHGLLQRPTMKKQLWRKSKREEAKQRRR
jgi:hypothetical protein